MTPLWFLSRHAPTETQCDLAKTLGYDDIRQADVAFDGDLLAAVRRLGLVPGDTLALVAPLYVGLTLLRAGYRIVEFVNDVAARQQGDFNCVGAYTHSLTESQFTARDR